MRKYKKEITAGMLLIIMIFICSMSYAYAMSAPIPSVIITSENVSYEEKAPGSWQIEKSAKWISKSKARVTFDVDTILMSKEEASDIIFVVDTSSSMDENKLNQVKTESVNLINTILSNSNNHIALIEFNSNASILSDFTNDKDLLINEINNLQVRDSTNYYNAFLKVEELLQSYQKQDNREVVMMFLTDGYPYEGNPNQVTEYKYLKETYPYLTVNAIQYEMGEIIIDQLKEVSDNQYLAFQDNLGEILEEASITPVPYEEFQIIDYIDNDYYTLNSVDDIKVSDGEVTLTEENGVQKITWTINNYLSGRKAKLTMDISLNNEYIGQGGVYPTNKGEEVISKIENQSEDVNSNLTPTLAEKYQVIYDGNAPEGVSVENIPDSEAQSVFGTVEITDEEPTCNGYIFQGWEIVTNNVKKIGGDYFIMPEENVTLRAKWSKIKLAKSMDGVVSEEGDPIMRGRDWWDSAYDETNVTSVEMKTNTDIPDTAIYSWDASVAGDRSVIAYLEDDGSGNGTYKVTIGGRGGVIANNNASRLFYGFTNMTTINLSSFDTSNTTSIANMFTNCQNLIELDLSGFNTSNITNTAGLVQYCYSLQSINLDGFDTSKVTTMNSMFSDCRNLELLDISHFNTSKVTNMAYMFNGCSKLENLNLNSFNTKNVINMQCIFSGCGNIKSLNLSNFNTSKVIDMQGLFNNCPSLTDINISNFDTSKVTNMNGMFNNCGSLTSLDVSSFKTSEVINMANMFNGCANLISLDLSNFDTPKVENISTMFQGCRSLTSLNISSFDTSNVTNMRYMFNNCQNIVELDLTSFNASKVTTMQSMFQYCSNLSNIIFSSNFSTANVTNMNSMFAGCGKLTELDLTVFNTSKVTDMAYMFNNCSNLTSLNLTGFDTSKITSMNSMFSNCSSLTELDLSSFDTSSLTDTSQMFYNCSSLKRIDFRKADFSSVATFTNMFYRTSNLEVIVKDEDVRVWMQDKLGSNGTATIVTA